MAANGYAKTPGTEAPAVMAPEQVAYARVIAVGSRVALGVLVVALALYLTGIAPAFVPLAEMPRYWSLPADDFVRAAQVPTGWGWVRLVRHGDFLSLAGIALLSSVTIGGYLVLLRTYLAKRDTLYAAIVTLELLVLGLAASGLVAGGH